MIEFVQNGITHYIEDGLLQSVDPPESYFGFTYWSFMIPPFKPESILMLGCGKHTVIKLIEKVYGKDFELECSGDEDAFKFVKKLAKKKKQYDYVIVDFWEGGKVYDEVLSGTDFIKSLDKLSKGLIVLNVNTGLFKLYETQYGNYFEILLTKQLTGNDIVFLKKLGDIRMYLP